MNDSFLNNIMMGGRHPASIMMIIVRTLIVRRSAAEASRHFNVRNHMCRARVEQLPRALHCRARLRLEAFACLRQVFRTTASCIIRNARKGGDPPAPPTVPSIPAKLSEEDARIAVSQADGPGLRRPREERGRARERKRRVFPARRGARVRGEASTAARVVRGAARVRVHVKLVAARVRGRRDRRRRRGCRGEKEKDDSRRRGKGDS